MDPVSHALFGRTLVALDQGRRLGPGALVAAVLGSLAPDIDVVLVPWGFDNYLAWHEMGTHSLGGIALVALLTALVVRAAVAASRMAGLSVAALAGALGHLFWDLASGGEIRLLHPLLDRRFGWHLVAMGDPLVLGLLLCSALFFPRVGRRGAIALLAALALLLGAKLASRVTAARAFTSAARARGESPAARTIDARPASWSRWIAFDREGDRLRVWSIDAWRGTVTLERERRDASAEPIVRATESLPVVRNLRRIAVFPHAWTEQAGSSTEVFWSDLQFCARGACGLAFGAALDERGRPHQQIVGIGPLRLVRPVPEASR